MALPNITVVGNTTGPAELRFTPSGKAVCNFTVVANKRKRTDAGGWEDDGRSPFIRVSLWERDAEAAAEVLDAPRKVIVTGQLKAREYDDRDGNKRESIELDFATVGVIPQAENAERSNDRAGRVPANNPDPWARPGGNGQGDPWGQPNATDEPPF